MTVQRRVPTTPPQVDSRRRLGPVRAPSAESTTAHGVLSLQRRLGNRRVSRMLAGPVSILRASAAMGTAGQTWVRLGSRGPEVTQLQQNLNAIGTAGTPVPETGIFDSATDRVVRQFQRDSGILVDGIVGPHTWEAVDRHAAGTTENVSAGTDHHAGVDRPTDAQIADVDAALNPTSTGPGGAAQDWDGRNDPAKRDELKTALLAALQAHLDDKTPHMQAAESAKAAGNVLDTDEQEGAGQGAKRYVDDLFGDIVSAAVLTRSQESARAAFNFESGVNLLDASDPSVRTPDPRDLSEWMADTDDDAQSVQDGHGFNRRRTTQGEPAFFEAVLTEFMATGNNQTDLERYDQFGFAFAEEGPRVLSQVAVVSGGRFSDTPTNPGEPSPAERRQRWATWELLTHEYIHTLAHPSFNAAAGGQRILTEGICEFLTREVLLDNGAIANAKADGDPALRREVEGGDIAGFDPDFVPTYNAGEYASYVEKVEEIVAAVGAQAVKSAFFFGHVHNIGMKPDGSMIDPTAPDADQFLAPEKVMVPSFITSVTGLSIMTGAPEADIVAANAGLTPGGPLPADAHTTGLEVPGTSYHRPIAVSSRTERVVETKDDIAQQHGTTTAAIQRANPNLNHREPREGEWVLIPIH